MSEPIIKTFYCGICEEQVEHEVPEDAVEHGIEAAMDHFRVLHPDTFAEIERWPDGAPVVVDQTIEPDDFVASAE